MTVKDVCARYHITPDTLRFYERVGAIPAVSRAENGIRSYTEQDIGWVENAICMRSSGVPVEKIAQYVKLCQQGDGTFSARRDLLREVREDLLRQIEKRRKELERLEYKIERYEAAMETGALVWDRSFAFDPDTGSLELRADGLLNEETR